MKIISVKRILGIDPGFGRMGFGIIEKEGSDWKLVTYGCLETGAESSFSHRLMSIHEGLIKIIKKYSPDMAAVEDLFFYKNLKTAIKVGEARGVILLTLQLSGLPVEEYTPLQIKQAMTGYGRAEKSQIQAMVKMILKMKVKSIQDDAADALAVALTSGANLRFKRLKKG